MANNAPRIMIAGTGSGCGKTMVTLTVLRAMQRRNIPLAAFKCGPDYIDPMFHKAVLGIPSRNLDLFFISEREVRGQIVRSIPQNGIGVIEGVMGFYDGVSGTTDTASAAHLARETGTPAILVVRPKGQSLSLAAMLSGFRNYAENTLCGVILNGISDKMYPFYRDIVQKSGLKVLGYLPSVPEAEIPDRHLGLVTADELKDLNYRLDLLADAAENRIDIEQILKISRTASQLSDDSEKISPVTKKPVRVAVARDRAFCFYYEDNFEVLRNLGAELVEFSPISDSCIPENTDGLYLGGGYPETYRKELAENLSMKESICEAAKAGKPIIAECGGFMYVCNHLVETDDSSMDMLGLIDTDVHMTKRLSMQFGYVTLNALCDTAFFKKNTNIRAHEFHYSKADKRGDSCEIKKYSGKCWNGLYAKENIMAGYPHFYFHNCREVAERFVDMAEKISKNLSM